MIKLCKKCGIEKPLSEFYDNSERRGGKAPYCKICTKSYMRNRYNTSLTAKAKRQALYDKKCNTQEFKAAAKIRSQKSFQSIEGRARSLLRCALRSPDGCSIDIDFVIRGIEHGNCPITRIPFDLTNGHQKITGRAKNPYAPSLDRINPKGPYSPENTRVVIWQYNMMKGELTDSEIVEICTRIVGNRARLAA